MVWLIFPTAYNFLMISPNLHAIWVVFFLNLSQELKLVLLLYFGTLGERAEENYRQLDVEMRAEVERTVRKPFYFHFNLSTKVYTS